MKPFTIYHLHPHLFSIIQNTVVEKLKRIIQPTAIFLLGAGINRDRRETIFNNTAPTTRYIGDCLVLVLTPDITEKEILDWQQKIQEDGSPQLTAIVLRRKSFERQLREADPFAMHMLQSAVLLFKEEDVLLPAPGFNSRPHISVETDYTEGLNRSKEFLAGAELFMKRKQFAIATFMIHQSIEQSLRTFIRIGLCYSINTHNINKLIRYAIWVDHRLPAIVLRKTNEQKRLYSLLQQSYIESRYTRNFSIHERDVATLIVKATEIQDLLVKSGMEIIQATISSVTV